MIKGPPVDLMGFLFGDVFAVTIWDIAWILVGGAVVLAVVAWLWQPLLRLAVHEELAAAEGVGRERVRLVFTLLLAVTIAVAMKIVGILLVMAFLVVPGRRRASAGGVARAHGGADRAHCRGERVRGAVAVGHVRFARRPLDRHRHVAGCGPILDGGGPETAALSAPGARGQGCPWSSAGGWT